MTCTHISLFAYWWICVHWRRPVKNTGKANPNFGGKCCKNW